ncbi:MAG: serine/threonine protein kinase [Myxococcales bacterium]|nr:MAG: serine/threonine protein kinase [Myxococcales bacterium]
MTSSVINPDPYWGQLVQERYRVLRKIGEGGMAAVYEGKHELIGKRVAIKFLNLRNIQDPSAVKRFEQEARAASLINHEHIIDVNDLGTLADGTPYMVMEYLEGEDLSSRIQSGPLPIKDAVHIAIQVCDALQAAHRHGVIHRDLKPENIFLIQHSGDESFVKVLDFGISKLQTPGNRLEQNLTQTGVLIGTPRYMAPEQASGAQEVDHRADIYSLGVILYSALAGRPPFDGPTFTSLMVKVMTENAPPLSGFRQGIPQELERIIAHAMEKDPKHRIQSADALKTVLLPFVSKPENLAKRSSRPADTSLQFGDNSPLEPDLFWDATSHTLDNDLSKGLEEDRSMMQSQRVPALRHPMLSAKPKAKAKPSVLYVATFALLVTAATGWLVCNRKLLIAKLPIKQIETVKTAVPKPIDKTIPSSLVRVQIDVSPENAEVLIDGVLQDSPMDLKREASLVPAMLEIRKKGYQSIKQPMVFDQDSFFHFELKRNRRKIGLQ